MVPLRREQAPSRRQALRARLRRGEQPPPAYVHDSAMDVIDHFRHRVITGDVASRVGLQIHKAEHGLQAFAANNGASWRWSSLLLPLTYFVASCRFRDELSVKLLPRV